LQKQLGDAEIEIVAGEQKSEFAVRIDDRQAFSRLEERRFPELEDLLVLCRKQAAC
jgi:hypothetical protein